MRSRSMWRGYCAKPPYRLNLKVNPGNPINHGLLHWYLFNDFSLGAGVDDVRYPTFKDSVTGGIATGLIRYTNQTWVQYGGMPGILLARSTLDRNNHSYVTLPNVTLQNYTFVITFYHNEPSLGAGAYAVFGYDNYDASPRECVYLAAYFSSLSKALVECSVGGTDNYITFTTLSQLVKYTVAIVRNGTTVTVYINGALQAGTIAVGSGVTALINGYLGGHYYQGAHHDGTTVIVDDFEIFNRALAADEIKTLWLEPYGSANNPRLIPASGLRRGLYSAPVGGLLLNPDLRGVLQGSNRGMVI